MEDPIETEGGRGIKYKFIFYEFLECDPLFLLYLLFSTSNILEYRIDVFSPFRDLSLTFN